jgi:hypothetical protein
LGANWKCPSVLSFQFAPKIPTDHFPLILAGALTKNGLCGLLCLWPARQILQFYSRCHTKAFIIFNLASKGKGKQGQWQGFLETGNCFYHHFSMPP